LTVPALKLLGYKRTSKLLESDSSSLNPVDNSDELIHAKNIADLVFRIGWHLPIYISCLARSLVLQKILQIYHIPGELIIGVPRDQKILQDFQAHAWVEYQGIVLNDLSDIEASYTKIYSDNRERCASEKHTEPRA